MAAVNFPTTHATIAPNIGTIAAGMATAFRTTLNNYMGSVEDKAQLAQAYHERLLAHYGFGGIGGGIMSAGTGLTVIVTAATAFVGNIVGTDSSSTVALTASTLNYIWFRQAGLFTAGTSPIAPGTADGYGTACLWGQVNASGTASSAIDSAKPIFQAWNRSATVSLAGTPGQATVTLQQASARRLVITGGISGTPQVTFPLVAGDGSWAEWNVYNLTAYPVACFGTVGGTVTIASAKTAVIGSNGTSVMRCTSDA